MPDVVVDMRVSNLDKALNVGSIVANEPVAELENIHTCTSSEVSPAVVPHLSRAENISSLTSSQNLKKRN